MDMSDVPVVLLLACLAGAYLPRLMQLKLNNSMIASVR